MSGVPDFAGGAETTAWRNAFLRAGAAESVGLGPEDPVADLIAGGILTAAAVQSAKPAADKVAGYISGIVERATGGSDQYQYALVAQTPGLRPNVRGGTTFLNPGDVYKYGTSVDPTSRYTQSELRALNVVPLEEYYGSATSVLIQEKLKLLGYFSVNGSLPPGNRIWR